MKICTTIASLLALSTTCGWSDPNIEWTTLRVTQEENKAFCSVLCTRLTDMGLDERHDAYAVFYVDTHLSWIVYLGKVSPQTEHIGTVTYAPWSLVQEWNRAEIVICPLDEQNFAYEMASMKWDDRFDRPIRKPRPKDTFNMKGPNPHWKGQAEAQDASAQVNTKDHC